MARKVVAFSRDHRRAPKWTMGLPPRRPKRHRWRWYAVFVVLFLFGPPAVDAINGFVKKSDSCRIWAVIDGDSVRMWCPYSGPVTGRILAYDTPEYNARCASELVNAVRATFALRWMLWSAREISARLDGRDRYGRHLVVLLVDGQGVARRMVELGLARWYDGGLRTSWCN